MTKLVFNYVAVRVVWLAAVALGVLFWFWTKEVSATIFVSVVLFFVALTTCAAIQYKDPTDPNCLQCKEKRRW